jgi:hypothetical protein
MFIDIRKLKQEAAVRSAMHNDSTLLFGQSLLELRKGLKVKDRIKEFRPFLKEIGCSYYRALYAMSVANGQRRAYMNTPRQKAINEGQALLRDVYSLFEEAADPNLSASRCATARSLAMSLLDQWGTKTFRTVFHGNRV